MPYDCFNRFFVLISDRNVEIVFSFVTRFFFVTKPRFRVYAMLFLFNHASLFNYVIRFYALKIVCFCSKRRMIHLRKFAIAEINATSGASMLVKIAKNCFHLIVSI